VKRYIATWLKALPILFLSVNALAFDFFEGFEGPISSSAWTVSGSPGYSVQFTGGSGAFTKANGVPDGSATLTTAFSFDGDFSVSVDADGRFDGALSEVLKISWVNNTSFAQIYLESPQLTYHQLGTSGSAYNSNARQTNTLQVKFLITRVGTTVALAVDRGAGGFETFLSGTNAAFAGPVVAQLIAWDSDSGSNAGGTAYFDNLRIQATVPEPWTAVLFGAGLLCFWRRFSRSAA
jgi:hypothetical protein